MKLLVPRPIQIAGRAGFAVLGLLLLASILFPPFGIADEGGTNLWMSWRWGFFADRQPGEHWDLFFLSVELYAIISIAYSLHLAIKGAAKPQPVRGAERSSPRGKRRALRRRHH